MFRLQLVFKEKELLFLKIIDDEKTV